MYSLYSVYQKVSCDELSDFYLTNLIQLQWKSYLVLLSFAIIFLTRKMTPVMIQKMMMEHQLQHRHTRHLMKENVEPRELTSPTVYQ